jgi:hypothetical protein
MGTGTMDGSTDGGADGGVAAAASLEQAPPDNGANPPARKKT